LIGGNDFFLWQKFSILLKEKVPSNMVKGTFWNNFKKNCHILREKVMKLPRFLKDFGQISGFLLLKSEYFQKTIATF
jgi:hypothetical protein